MTTTHSEALSPCRTPWHSTHVGMAARGDSARCAREAARALYRQRRPHAAMAGLERWLAKHPDDGDTWELLGVMSLLENHIEPACNALEAAAAARQLSVGGQLALTECYRRLALQRAANT